MPNIELSISPNYVGEWSVKDATRELFQNALDQQTLDPENLLIFDYNPATMLMRIGNRKSALTTSSLLLGNSTKRRDERLIGQFGEGYKLALIVLLRLGKRVTIYNKPEVWTPTILHSAVFDAPVLNIHTKKYRFKECPVDDLMFEVAGITEAEFEEIKGSNRYFHVTDIASELVHEYGTILMAPSYAGQIFVNGLYVTTLKSARFGYDLKPAHIQVGRDRDLVDTWDIFYKTAQMWAAQTDHAELVNEMIEAETPDLEKIAHCVWQLPKHTVEYVGGRWREKHGATAIACSNEEEAEKARTLRGEKVKIVMVNKAMKAILESAPQFRNEKAEELARQTPQELILKLLDHPDKTHFKPSIRTEIEAIAAVAKYWTWR